MDLSALLTGKNAMLAGSIYVLTQTFKLVAPEFFATRVGQRLTPVLPLLLGVAMAMLGLCENAPRWQDKVMIGLLAAFTAGHLFKVGKTSFLGWGVDATPGGRGSSVPPEGTAAAIPVVAPSGGSAPPVATVRGVEKAAGASGSVAGVILPPAPEVAAAPETPEVEEDDSEPSAGGT